MTKFNRILGIIVLILGFLVLSQHSKAQNVQLKGKTFIAVKDSSHKSQSVKTEYVYVDNNNSYPVYLSKNGKAANILRISKKTGKWKEKR